MSRRTDLKVKAAMLGACSPKSLGGHYLIGGICIECGISREDLARLWKVKP
jgi:hypothetical protein